MKSDQDAEVEFLSLDHVNDKILRVFIRKKLVRPSKDDMHPLQGYAMTLERELYGAEIHYQGINIIEDDEPYLQILCRDAEEQEHLKHILLKQPYVLCFEQHQQRFYGLRISEEEKQEFKRRQQ